MDPNDDQGVIERVEPMKLGPVHGTTNAQRINRWLAYIMQRKLPNQPMQRAYGNKRGMKERMNGWMTENGHRAKQITSAVNRDTDSHSTHFNTLLFSPLLDWIAKTLHAIYFAPAATTTIATTITATTATTASINTAPPTQIVSAADFIAIPSRMRAPVLGGL
ncbi:hypothetical protein K440DRAFT_638229 [Wilcoxina mikolae CBS 423.85]|nr:hypothetical protein K440DRAFT_638229 [Wilcoxina mikolae CBS 423.85]